MCPVPYLPAAPEFELVFQESFVLLLLFGLVFCFSLHFSSRGGGGQREA